MKPITQEELAALKHSDRELYTTHVELVVEATTRLEVAIDNLKPAIMRLERHGSAAIEHARQALLHAERALSSTRSLRSLLK
jgi:hypothetical protein